MQQKLFPLMVTCHRVVDCHTLPLILVEWLTIGKIVLKLSHLQNISHFWKFSYCNLFCPKMAATTKMATQSLHNLEFVIYFGC